MNDWDRAMMFTIVVEVILGIIPSLVVLAWLISLL